MARILLKTENPLYRRIYDDLAGKILSGDIGYREKLPPLPELCRHYGVSEVSVRRALADLERANFILRERGRGKGTIAIRPPVQIRLRLLLMDDLENARSPVELCHETYDLIAGIRAAAADCSATLQTVSQRGYNSQRMSKADTGYLIIAQGGDGYAEGAAMAVRQDTPFVMINPPSARTPCVRVDMRVGPYEAVSHLSQSGHRRIAYVGSAAGDWFAPRFAGYRRALMENDLPFDPALVIETDGVEAQQDERALDRLLTLSSPPTAIFACSDYRALHLLNHCRHRGIAVPGDLSLCGYDDIDEIAGVEPALTSVHHPRYELGARAVALLCRLICGDNSQTLDQVLPTRLIVRDSSAPPVSLSLSESVPRLVR